MVVQTGRHLLGEPVSLIHFAQHQAAGIRGYLTTLQVSNNFLGEKTFKPELFMAECVQRVSRLRDCLLSDYSILADTLSYFKNFS